MGGPQSQNEDVISLLSTSYDFIFSINLETKYFDIQLHKKIQATFLKQSITEQNSTLLSRQTAVFERSLLFLQAKEY
jgi:hypothetical protein